MEKSFKVYPPRVPNFIEVENDAWIPLFQFTELELKEIGRVWTENLLARREEMAKTPDEEKSKFKLDQ